MTIHLHLRPNILFSPEFSFFLIRLYIVIFHLKISLK